MKSRIIAYTGSLGLTLAVPFIALAQASSGPNTSRIFQLVNDLKRLLDLLIPIAITLALLFFIWGLAQFILASGDEEKKKEGKQRMIWGIVALFVIVSVWGIVAFIANIFGVEGVRTLPTPCVPPCITP